MNARVREILSVVLEMPASDIDERLSAETASNWDSIRHLNLVMAIEEAFDVSFASEELSELTSYRAIADALAKRGVADR
jgi:acyl carrier protein